MVSGGFEIIIDQVFFEHKLYLYYVIEGGDDRYSHPELYPAYERRDDNLYKRIH